MNQRIYHAEIRIRSSSVVSPYAVFIGVQTKIYHIMAAERRILRREDCSTVGDFVADYSDLVSVEIQKNKSTAILSLPLASSFTCNYSPYIDVTARYISGRLAKNSTCLVSVDDLPVSLLACAKSVIYICIPFTEAQY